jgi:hypothetical protein
MAAFNFVGKCYLPSLFDIHMIKCKFSPALKTTARALCNYKTLYFEVKVACARTFSRDWHGSLI